MTATIKSTLNLPMKINIPIAEKADLLITDKQSERGEYATSCLPKGIILVANGLDLAEEAVGFGFPVVKMGLQALFPGSLELSYRINGLTWTVQSRYKLNLVEKIHRPGIGNVKSPLLYASKNIMAALIRQPLPLRGLLTSVSSGLRKVFNWETAYEDAGFFATINLVYTIHENIGKIQVEIDATNLPESVTEIVIMNELGARSFDRYEDSCGISLSGKDIGCWDEVKADKACFISSSHQISFNLGLVNGVRLFRGRELISSRLAWSGFGYAFPPSIKKFKYELGIEKSA